LPRAAVGQALGAHLPKRHKALLELPYQALRRGAALVTGINLPPKWPDRGRDE
jgi:hypothetical protein